MGLNKPKMYDIVEVKWVDSVIYPEVYTVDKKGYIELPKISERKTIGYFIHKTKKQITLATTIDEDSIAEVNVIPTDWQISIKIIKKCKK